MGENVDDEKFTKILESIAQPGLGEVVIDAAMNGDVAKLVGLGLVFANIGGNLEKLVRTLWAQRKEFAGLAQPVLDIDSALNTHHAKEVRRLMKDFELSESAAVEICLSLARAVRGAGRSKS